jgi:uncharacterized secreted protein with C-terminal beta-propeller domain
MRVSGTKALLAVPALLVAAGLVATASSTTSANAKAGRLVAFSSCGQLLGYAKSQAGRFVGPWGLAGRNAVVLEAMPAPATAAAAGAARDSATPEKGVDYSGTNVQEAGVDEPDLVKTDGKTLFAVANGSLESVDVRTAKPRLLDTLALDAYSSQELFLHDNRLLVISRGGYWAEPLPAMAARMIAWAPSQSVLTEVDVSDPSNLRVVRTLTLDGAYVTARMIGSHVRVVATSQVPEKLPFVQPQSSSADALASAAARNRSVLAGSKASSWLPSYRIKRQGKAASPARALVQCRDVRRPPVFSGLGMLTVLTVDLSKGLEPVDSTAVMTDARIVYASQSSLYAATERWATRPDPSQPTEAAGSGVTTEIHKFDISDPKGTVYRGSGKVSGYLLSQWSLSEFGGVLRVVSTETPSWWGDGGGESESYLTTLREQGGGLAQVGRIGGLGKGERVYAVRFVGNTGYVVTFRQIDPLYTLDLADPQRPRVVGELKITGYSSYLHPVDDDLVIGIGQEADENGRPLGTAVSLFDVSDLRTPKLLHRAALGAGWSEAESDHHAFLYWPRTGLLVVPFVERALGYKVTRGGGIAQVGTVEHGPGNLSWTPPIRRSLVVGDKVVTLSDAGVKASSLATLAEQGWATFPAPPAQPKPIPIEPIR